METKKILVIEDTPKHLDDAKAFFADKPEYEVTYVTNGHEGMKALEKAPPDGVITDVYMPMSNYGTGLVEQPFGLGIAMICREKKIPCVMLTAGFHHGAKYQWITDLCPVFFAIGHYKGLISSSGSEVESLTKGWDDALKQLEFRMSYKKRHGL